MSVSRRDLLGAEWPGLECAVNSFQLLYQKSRERGPEIWCGAREVRCMVPQPLLSSQQLLLLNNFIGSQAWGHMPVILDTWESEGEGL